jgi:hypothetical protein
MGFNPFCKKTDKFSEIISSHDILEYKFTLNLLYSNTGSCFKWE